MHRLVPVKDAVVSGLYESFVCNGRFQNTASGNCPISLSRVPVPVSLPLGHSQFYKVLHSRSGELPLFPNIGAESSSQPFVPPLHCRLHTRNPEVAQPAPGVDFYVLHHDPDISALAAGSQFFSCSALSLCGQLRFP